MGSQILVVDDDAIMQEVIFASLEPLGYVLDAASDGAGAFRRAIRCPPDLVISDVMMPGMDGWALVRRLRAHPRLGFVPFIFLSALSTVDDVLKGFRLGADDYLPKPFTREALIERVNHALQRRKTLERAARGLLSLDRDGDAAAIRGSLAEVGLSSLLVLLEIDKKSGVLAVRRGDPKETCKLHLRDGRVFQARFDRGPTLVDAEAVYYLLGWSQGTFEFRAADGPLADTIGISTTGLLLEAARRADEGDTTDDVTAAVDGLEGL